VHRGGVAAVDPLLHDDLRVEGAALRAGVDVRLAHSAADIRAVSELLAAVWGTEPTASPAPRNVLAAIADTGGYIAGAWNADGLVGASFGLTYLDSDGPCLRSQVTGVLQPGQGCGEALKRHQWQWANEQGMRRITWTFDPLVRRNARFNLARLGVRLVRFVPDFYGSLDDGLNGSDETDRCVVSWTVGEPTLPRRLVNADELLHDGHSLLLAPGFEGRPVMTDARLTKVLVATPEDIVGLRRTDPSLALSWRQMLRDAFSRVTEAGLIADLVTIDGYYRFIDPAEEQT